MCEAASRPVGEPLVVVGHGLRQRTVYEPSSLEDRCKSLTVSCRRFRCRRCESVLLVVPSGIVGRHRYTLPTIVFALALWGIEGLSLARVRKRLARDRVVGFMAAAEWITLRRWARTFCRGGQTLRAASAKLAQQAIGCASQAGSVGEMAFDGARQATFWRGELMRGRPTDMG